MSGVGVCVGKHPDIRNSAFYQVMVFLEIPLAGCAKESLVLKLKRRILGLAAICNVRTLVPGTVRGSGLPAVGV